MFNYYIFLNKFLNKNKIRQIKTNNNFYAVINTDNLYDIVTYAKSLYNNKYLKFLKNLKNDIHNLLLHNKLILETSKKFYKISLKELQVN